MLTIDGAQGEGGGQILRSALALSLVTGKPFRIINIRRGRKKPGLMRQHLAAVRAAVDIGAAEVSGNHLHSQHLSFTPQAVQAGAYGFSVGSAGSCTLVLQTILPALCLVSGASEIELEGGTHNPFAPPFDFIARAFLPLLARMGPRIVADLKKPGFFPAGGGRVLVRIEPTVGFKRMDLPDRGAVLGYRACARVANLPRHIAEREIRTVETILGWRREDLFIEELTNSKGPGNILTLEIISENVTEMFTGFGERGVPAEHVARRACRQAQEYLAADVPVGPHLADQLLLPMALAGGGSFRTLAPTGHTYTHIDIIKAFLDIDVKIRQKDLRRWEIFITGDHPRQT